jgi:hypothetical protein
VDHYPTIRCRIAVPKGRRTRDPKAAWVYGAHRHNAAQAGSALPNTQYRRRVPPAMAFLSGPPARSRRENYRSTADRMQTRGACAQTQRDSSLPMPP